MARQRCLHLSRFGLRHLTQPLRTVVGCIRRGDWPRQGQRRRAEDRARNRNAGEEKSSVGCCTSALCRSCGLRPFLSHPSNAQISAELRVRRELIFSAARLRKSVEGGTWPIPHDIGKAVVAARAGRDDVQRSWPPKALLDSLHPESLRYAEPRRLMTTEAAAQVSKCIEFCEPVLQAKLAEAGGELMRRIGVYDHRATTTSQKRKAVAAINQAKLRGNAAMRAAYSSARLTLQKAEDELRAHLIVQTLPRLCQHELRRLQHADCARDILAPQR